MFIIIYMSNFIKNYLRKVLLEIIDEPGIKPEFEKLKEYRIHNKKVRFFKTDLDILRIF